ncbi:hypothetical protein BofuT4_uP155460.1 [Botrytis cinerea T4]|uniref:Uncharacterized protein n=1 Tax=Botryotinia fuckeliana (strain T4) TaxID=999810 RepID=G2YVA7_BOTF4|nr:hypothetical protein BofuT4_uP155460.1 [Botrytis cinerea T4]
MAHGPHSSAPISPHNAVVPTDIPISKPCSTEQQSYKISDFAIPMV